MSSSARIFIGLAVAALVAVIGFFVFTGGGDDAQMPAQPTPVVEATAVPTPSLQEQLSDRLKGTTLSASDEIVRTLAETLSDHPKLVAWLANEDLVRRFVASVHNVAEAKSPRSHLDFLKPKGSFRVRERGDAFVIDERSYDRYDLAVAVFESVDTTKLGELYAELEPLMDEAHREIAPPNTTFRAVLSRAFDHLLATPEIGSSEVVEAKVVTYVYRDPTLEGLSGAQKQLLRLGPANVDKVRAKLTELRQVLGV